MIIFFKDKGAISVTDEQRAEEFLAQFKMRSIERRAKFNIGFDEKDIPVNSEYMTLLSEAGTINSASKWLNAVSFTP